MLVSLLKTLKSYQRFTQGQHLAGITRLQDISGLGSGGNHIYDISFEKKYATLLGFTEEEISEYFQAHIKELARNFEPTEEDAVLARLKEEFNGYKFSFEDCESVYNPYSIVKCLSFKKFDYFWDFSNKNPLKLQELYENYAMSGKSDKDFAVNIGSNDISYQDPDFIQLMWQYGYLTIHEKRDRQVILKYPNKEAKSEINKIKVSIYQKIMPPSKELRKKIALTLLIDKRYTKICKIAM